MPLLLNTGNTALQQTFFPGAQHVARSGTSDSLVIYLAFTHFQYALHDLVDILPNSEYF